MVRRIPLLAVLLGLMLALGACGGAGVPIASRVAAVVRIIRDPKGWRIDLPAGFEVEHSDSGPGRVEFIETTLATFAPRGAIVSGKLPDGGSIDVHPPLDAGGRFPADGVALRLKQIDGGPAPYMTVPDSRLPIQVSTLVPQSGSEPDRNLGVPVPRVRAVLANGVGLEAELFVGPQASPAARRAAEAALASLSFVHLRPGQGPNGLVDLGSPGRFPVGSFTLIRAAGQPSYLVHAHGRLRVLDRIAACPVTGGCAPAGAFYALGWKYEDLEGGYRSRCRLRFDRSTETFSCTNSAARWDRMGRPLMVPRGARTPDALQFAFAKLGWDGQLLISPGVDENPPRTAAAQLLWPHP